MAEIPERPSIPERPPTPCPFNVGRRSTTIAWPIKQTNDYIHDAAVYMDALEARIRELEQERERHLEDLRRKGDINLHLLDEKISLQAQLAAVQKECSALREERNALSDRSSEQDKQLGAVTQERDVLRKEFSSHRAAKRAQASGLHGELAQLQAHNKTLTKAMKLFCEDVRKATSLSLVQRTANCILEHLPDETGNAHTPEATKDASTNAR